jgi:hypothetical protein
VSGEIVLLLPKRLETGLEDGVTATCSTSNKGVNSERLSKALRGDAYLGDVRLRVGGELMLESA